jgi:hypothetical protein
MWWEGAFTFSLLPSEIAFILSIIYDNLVTVKDYFSMSKSSVPLECTEGLLIRVQPNTYIEKTEHFWTASHLVKQRGQLNKGYNTQEVWEIQPSFAGIYCVFSGLRNKPHWQDFPSNWSIIKELVKCKTKQSCLRSFSTSRGPHLIPGEYGTRTCWKNLFTKSKITSSLAIVEMWLGPAALMVARTTRLELMMRLRAWYHWKVQQKRT